MVIRGLVSVSKPLWGPAIMRDLIPLLPEQNYQDRDCRPCSECCSVLPIAHGHLNSNSKSHEIPCKWLGSSECRIHAQRFELCRRFKCAWLDDASWDQSWRPDLAGLLCLREWIDNKFPAAIVYELRDGVIASPEAIEILAELCRTTVSVTIIGRDGSRSRLVGAWKPDENKDLVTLGQVRIKTAA